MDETSVKMKIENRNIKGTDTCIASKKLEALLEKNNWETRMSIKGEMTGFFDPSTTGVLGFIVKDIEKDSEFLVEANSAIHFNELTKNGKKCGFLDILKMGEEVEVTGIVVPNMVTPRKEENIIIPGRDPYIFMVAEKMNGTGIMLGDGSGKGRVLKNFVGMIPRK